jgi:hypothetical protein
MEKAFTITESFGENDDLLPCQHDRVITLTKLPNDTTDGRCNIGKAMLNIYNKTTPQTLATRVLLSERALQVLGQVIAAYQLRCNTPEPKPKKKGGRRG